MQEHNRADCNGGLQSHKGQLEFDSDEPKAADAETRSTQGRRCTNQVSKGRKVSSDNRKCSQVSRSMSDKHFPVDRSYLVTGVLLCKC